ncbi:MAG: AtpZ/AtpI family protein [Candidatus Sericytochromatia bacterium]|nr:AtpZ/AtpI family protein [Candidatus Sericytochromatia bacterium]
MTVRGVESVHMREVSAAYGLLYSLLFGAVLGYGIDVEAGSAPWGLIGMAVLGFGAGLYNLYRTLTQAS